MPTRFLLIGAFDKNGLADTNHDWRNGLAQHA